MSTDFQPDWTMPLSEYKRIQEQSMPKIKPLVWEACQYNEGWQIADAPIGKCYVLYREGEYKAEKAYQGDCFGFPKWFDTEAEAKAWCQSEYERRVRECLE